MSQITVRIPMPLRGHTGGAGRVVVEAASVREALTALDEAHAGLLDRLLDPRGELRPFVNVFVGEHNVRALAGLSTPLAEGDVLTLMPAVAGGGPP